MRLVFATNNVHKLKEVRRILPSAYDIVSQGDIGCTTEVEENGTTLEANSLIKARYIWDTYGEDCFADDTGLFIEALDGQPGVYTARWSGIEPCYANNRLKALDLLQGQSNRHAWFRTVITLILGGEIHQMEGRIDGTIALEERGNAGFGYDPIFIPDGYDLTFAELPAEVKNSISHRALAMAQLNQTLRSLS